MSTFSGCSSQRLSLSLSLLAASPSPPRQLRLCERALPATNSRESPSSPFQVDQISAPHSSPFPTSSQDHSLTEEGKFASNKSVPTVRCHLSKSQPHHPGSVCRLHSNLVARALLPKCALYGFTAGIDNGSVKPSLGRVSEQKMTFAISHNPSNLFSSAGCVWSYFWFKGAAGETWGGSNLPQFHP